MSLPIGRAVGMLLSSEFHRNGAAFRDAEVAVALSGGESDSTYQTPLHRALWTLDTFLRSCAGCSSQRAAVVESVLRPLLEEFERATVEVSAGDIDQRRAAAKLARVKRLCAWLLLHGCADECGLLAHMRELLVKAGGNKVDKLTAVAALRATFESPAMSQHMSMVSSAAAAAATVPPPLPLPVAEALSAAQNSSRQPGILIASSDADGKCDEAVIKLPGGGVLGSSTSETPRRTHGPKIVEISPPEPSPPLSSTTSAAAPVAEGKVNDDDGVGARKCLTLVTFAQHFTLALVRCAQSDGRKNDGAAPETAGVKNRLVPTRLTASAAECALVLTHALAVCAIEADTDDSRDDCGSVAAVTLATVWSLKSELTGLAALLQEWYGHRSLFSVAMRDLCTALSPPDAKNAALIEARLAEERATADRDGLPPPRFASSGAFRAVWSEHFRLAWTWGTFAPDLLTRKWHSEDRAKLKEQTGALKDCIEVLLSVAEAVPRGADSCSSGDAGSSEAELASASRLSLRRLCVLLGRLKPRRIDELLQAPASTSAVSPAAVSGAPTLEQHLVRAVAGLLRSSSDASVQQMAVALLEQSLVVVGNGPSSPPVDALPALLSIMDGREDVASKAVIALVARTLAMSPTPASISKVCSRLDLSHPVVVRRNALAVVKQMLELLAAGDSCVAAISDPGNLARNFAERLVVQLRDPDSAMRNRSAKLFALLDPDFVVPRLCVELGRCTSHHRDADGNDSYVRSAVSLALRAIICDHSDTTGSFLSLFDCIQHGIVAVPPVSSLSAAPAAPAAQPRCDVCGKRAAKRCGRCLTRWYCTAACQRCDWQTGHRKQCQQRSQNPGNATRVNAPQLHPGNIACGDDDKGEASGGGKTAENKDHVAGEDEAWVKHVLALLPQWLSSLASGKDWRRTLEAAVRKASSSPESTGSIRVLREFLPLASAQDVGETVLPQLALRMSQQSKLTEQLLESESQASAVSVRALLFERMNPLLILKLIPVDTLQDLHDASAGDEMVPNRDDNSLCLVASQIADRITPLYEFDEVRRLAAEVAGRLPAAHFLPEIVHQLREYVSAKGANGDPLEGEALGDVSVWRHWRDIHESAAAAGDDGGRVPAELVAKSMLFALCHALATKRESIAPWMGHINRVLLQLLLIPVAISADSPAENSLVQIQHGCIDCVAFMLQARVNASFAAGRQTREAEETFGASQRTPLITEVRPTKDHPNVGSAAGHFEDAASIWLSVLTAGTTGEGGPQDLPVSARICAGNAFVSAARRVPEPQLNEFHSHFLRPLVHCAATNCTPLLRASCLQAIFTAIYRGKLLPTEPIAGVSDTDLHMVALKSIRNESSEEVRLAGMKLLGALAAVAVDFFSHAQPSVVAQTRSSLQSIANLDTSPQLRVLADQTLAALFP